MIAAQNWIQNGQERFVVSSLTLIFVLMAALGSTFSGFKCQYTQTGELIPLGTRDICFGVIYGFATAIVGLLTWLCLIKPLRSDHNRAGWVREIRQAIRPNQAQNENQGAPNTQNTHQNLN